MFSCSFNFWHPICITNFWIVIDKIKWQDHVITRLYYKSSLIEVAYPWLESGGVSPRLATNAGGKQSSAMARAMNFPTIYFQQWMSVQNRYFLLLNYKAAYPIKYRCHISVCWDWAQKAPLEEWLFQDIILIIYSFLAFCLFFF